VAADHRAGRNQTLSLHGQARSPVPQCHRAAEAWRPAAHESAGRAIDWAHGDRTDREPFLVAPDANAAYRADGSRGRRIHAAGDYSFAWVETVRSGALGRTGSRYGRSLVCL